MAGPAPMRFYRSLTEGTKPVTMTVNERYERVKETLETHDQTHLLTFYGELNQEEQASLLEQIEAHDWDEIAELIQSHVLNEPDDGIPNVDDIEPPPYYPLAPSSELKSKYEEAYERGEDLLRQGKVAAFTVAGGQGTRLGWDGPKGTFPATPVNGKPLFQVFAEYIQKVQKNYDTTVPWYVMTSPINDEATREFFEAHDFFGLDKANVTFFSQGTMTSIGRGGKVLLAEKGKLAENPDGHGGSLKALYKSGAVEDMEERGVTQISYFQVDNPNVKCLDPLFIGLHTLDNAGMSSKMLEKVGPKEKVGNFVQVDGRIQIIEYSDIPDELAEARDEDGSLQFNAGSIAIHVISVDFVKQLNEGEGGFALPFHRADKAVPHLDLETGERVEPDEPNAVKLEMFVFDALPLAETSIILETDRVEEFAPIKNAEGDDSPQTSRQLQSQRAGRWLRQHGVEIPLRDNDDVDAVIELSPLTAIRPSDLENADLPQEVKQGEEVAL